MAEPRQVPGGRETPQGELRPEVEDEVPRSPVEEEPGGGRSNSSETKLSPREEEELDPRIQVRRLRGETRSPESHFHEGLDLFSLSTLGQERKNKFVSKSLHVL